MAYIVARRGGWELRVSEVTSRGPRSRTLTTFGSLGPEAIARGIERSGGSLTEDEITRLARRVGAPVDRDVATTAAATLLGELSSGRGIADGLRRALLDALEPGAGGSSWAERSASEWIAHTDVERGAALQDLLLAAEALPAPARERAATSRFPRLDSGAR